MSIMKEYKATIDILKAKVEKIESLISDCNPAIIEVLNKRKRDLINQINNIKTKIYLYNKGLDYFEIEELLNGN